MARARLLAELTFEEAERWRLLDPVVLLPVGATEAHGPHLPLSTDVLLSEALAGRAALALEAAGRAAFVAPSLAYAVTEFGAAFSGTVSLRPETAVALYTDVLCGLHRGGFVRVCIINSHLEPAHVACLREAALLAEGRSGHRVAFPDHTERRYARLLSEEYRRGNCHAGRYETSLLLAARPELVREVERGNLRANPADFLAAMRGGAGSFGEAGGPRAYFGDPQSATAAEGEGLYGLLLGMVLETVALTWPA